ncbi:bifunctional 3-(3-hydroxy-phenyl)propionate/3-hydroxycinnamic acid hydroxylase [Nocardioides sp. Kera G14]|uniref:bifunctional 3-(3-hydroxy-phenyl)propionate/3-hydroxycinnamic acid hydroxylase MhpA n=1 Tax=Nocardioides sp. Kera G14 TaxID=2884264 RepID=UPI001D127013|nr:bifunctional 3-(3-hydroxy-phenyl)propionate/3-hydroxycinnamic acid hydroxylase [Nocardioides sp. Kera G14]UDY23405.1 bifunctional 3-(3-hydroxy-phenyl)propionate/3-hydroxycinnamic acid hydroxylase [Nocardioides sp. Kera G14]
MTAHATEEEVRNASRLEADVVVVGLGPVGLLAAIKLGRAGHTVVGVERHSKPYPLPRAVTFDHEIARILKGIGIDPETDPAIVWYEDRYPMITADGQTLQEVDWISRNPDGFRNRYWFYQPLLEDRLRQIAAATPGVTLLAGYQAVEIGESDLGVTAEFHKSKKDETGERILDGSEALFVTARYGLGSDGANSFVRTSLGLEMTDLQFYYDWIVTDMIMHEERTFDPVHYQICDPARPTTVVPGGAPDRRRWEFMLLPGETPGQWADPESVWPLLAEFDVTPQNAEIHRSVVWRFQAKYAETWRKGRWMIAGDAAHLMPPFAGEGMCAGLRDVMNLSWRLSLALEGKADDAILDGYGAERQPHAKGFIEFSVGMGEVICVTDPEKAAERNARMIAEWDAIKENGPLWPADNPLGPGAWLGEYGGLPGRQGTVTFQGRTGPWDDIVGASWALLTSAPAAATVTEDTKSLLKELEGVAVTVGPEGSGADVLDVEGTYAQWFADTGADHLVIRPDYYVAAAVAGEDVNDVVRRLAEAVALKVVA